MGYFQPPNLFGWKKSLVMRKCMKLNVAVLNLWQKQILDWSTNYFPKKGTYPDLSTYKHLNKSAFVFDTFSGYKITDDIRLELAF